MIVKEERNERELDYTCYECDTTFKHTFRIERGLTGLKAKGHVQCPNCNYKVYAKIYLDRRQGIYMFFIDLVFVAIASIALIIVASILRLVLTIVALLVNFIPVILVCYCVCTIWDRIRDKKQHRIKETTYI